MSSNLGRTATSTVAFPHPQHEHSRCTADALRTAEEICAARGARLTDIRKQVLRVVWTSHAPAGAYDILATLNSGGGKTAPMAVYRALDFLMEQGLVHRLASLNAFIGCPHAEERHTAHFLICRVCKTAAEMQSPAVARAVDRTASEHGFTAEQQIVEIQGLCAHCGQNAAAGKKNAPR